jgi:hypothetical protein
MDDADLESADPEAEFLSSLWSHLDAAAGLSEELDVLDRLDEIAGHCEAAVRVIMVWRSTMGRGGK